MMQDLHVYLRTVCYCRYGMQYRKATSIWTNLNHFWCPKPMCTKDNPCDNVVDGKHTTRAQIRQGWTVRQLYALPAELCKELAMATTNACEKHSQLTGMLHKLREITVPFEKRSRVRDAGTLKKRGMVLGLVCDYASPTLTASKYTWKYPELCAYACNLAKQCFPDFVFTSIMVNVGGSTLHIDKNNSGPSMIVSLGNHTGGQLWQWPGEILDIHMKPTMCNGLVPHATLPFEGERYSLVYYSVKHLRGSPDIYNANYLKQLGFWPISAKPPAGKARPELMDEAAEMLETLINGSA